MAFTGAFRFIQEANLLWLYKLPWLHNNVLLKYPRQPFYPKFEEKIVPFDSSEIQSYMFVFRIWL